MTKFRLLILLRRLVLGLGRFIIRLVRLWLWRLLGNLRTLLGLCIRLRGIASTQLYCRIADSPFRRTKDFDVDGNDELFSGDLIHNILHEFNYSVFGDGSSGDEIVHLRGPHTVHEIVTVGPDDSVSVGRVVGRSGKMLNVDDLKDWVSSYWVVVRIRSENGG